MSDPYSQSFNWTSRANFFRAVKHAGRKDELEVLIFDHIPHSEFLGLLERVSRSDKTDPRFRIFAYEADLERLIVQIPSGPHEDTIQAFITGLNLLNGMSDLCLTTLKFRGAITESTPDGRIQAEPDQCITPRTRIRAGDQGFPTVIIEVGRSQHFRNLQQKARLWFTMSGGTVRIVLLIKISEQQSRITVEKWVRADNVRDQGPMTRRRAAGQQPIEAQCIQIISVEPAPGVGPQRLENPGPGDFHVLVAPNSLPLPMVLEFNVVCDRQPSLPAEADFNLDVAFFQRFAAQAWPISR